MAFEIIEDMIERKLIGCVIINKNQNEKKEGNWLKSKDKIWIINGIGFLILLIVFWFTEGGNLFRLLFFCSLLVLLIEIIRSYRKRKNAS